MKNVTGIILAGGKSSRMGFDKGFALLNGRPLISHIIQQLESLKLPILIIGDNPAYKQFGYPMYEDLYKDKGPMAGIYTGLVNSSTDLNIILSCDTPLVSSQLLEYLLSKSQNSEVTISMSNNKTHPLIGIYNKSLIERIKNSVEENHLKLTTLFNESNCKIVDFSNSEQFQNTSYFMNINTKQELDNLNEKITKAHYYGMIGEQIGFKSEDVFIDLKNETLNLNDFFEEKYPLLRSLSYKIAVNQEIMTKAIINEVPTEISLLPPFAGG